jgi:hypothetical protein
MCRFLMIRDRLQTFRPREPVESAESACIWPKGALETSNPPATFTQTAKLAHSYSRQHETR